MNKNKSANENAANIYRKLKNILFVDVETASAVESYQSLPERLQKLWQKKHNNYFKDKDLTPEESFFEKAGLYAEFGKIIAIGVGFFTLNEDNQLCLRAKVMTAPTEVKLLAEFKALIEEKFPSKNLTLCSHNGKEFDFPFLCRRMLLNYLEIPTVLNLSGKKPWEVPHIDTLEMWKFGDRKNYTSLELLAALFDIPAHTPDMDGSVVNQVYYKEKNIKKIIEYCREDIVALAQLYLKFNNMPLIDDNNIFRL